MPSAKTEYPTSPISPAFHIPLSEEELRTLGELCAIQGQIELLMQLTVMVLCKKSLQRARKLLSSPKLTANARVWLSAIEQNASWQDSKKIAKAVVHEIDALSRGRNDFVHAVFAFGVGEDGFSLERDLGVNGSPRRHGPAVVVHNLRTRPMADLQEIRDKAATISQFMMIIYDANSGVPRA